MEGTPAEKEEEELGGGSVRSEWGGGGGIPLEFKISSTLLWCAAELWACDEWAE